MKTAVPNHPKTKRLARRLGITRTHAVGLLVCLWNYARVYSKTGDLSALSPEDLAVELNMPDGRALVDALCAERWIDAHPTIEGAHVIHDWLDHCESYVIRDLIANHCLSRGFKRGDSVPTSFYNARLHTTQSCTARRSRAPARERAGEGEGLGKGKGKGKGKAGEGKGVQGAIPPKLNTPEFQSAWIDWVQHRVELKKPLTPLSVKKQLAALLEIGHDRAISAINHSIANRWQGIFEPDGNRGSTSKSAGADRRAAENRSMCGGDAFLDNLPIINVKPINSPTR